MVKTTIILVVSVIYLLFVAGKSCINKRQTQKMTTNKRDKPKETQISVYTQAVKWSFLKNLHPGRRIPGTPVSMTVCGRKAKLYKESYTGEVK